MKTQRAWPNRILRTAVILACILAPVLGIATEPSVNEQLLQAAKRGSLEQIKTLPARGGDVNARERNRAGHEGRTVLMWAVDPRNLKRFERMVRTAKKKAYWRMLEGGATGRRANLRAGWCGTLFVVRSGPPGVGASRKVWGLCFSRRLGDIEGWAYLVEERVYRGEPIDTTEWAPTAAPSAASALLMRMSEAKPRTSEQRKGLSYFVVAFLLW